MSRRRQLFIHSVVERSANLTHRPVLIVGPFLAIYHTAVNVENHGTGVHNAVMDVGNNYMGGY